MEAAYLPAIRAPPGQSDPLREIVKQNKVEAAGV